MKPDWLAIDALSIECVKSAKSVAGRQSVEKENYSDR